MTSTSTVPQATHRVEGPDRRESALVTRILETMLREDVLGLRSGSVTVRRADGRWLRLTNAVDHEALLLPVTADGFLCDDAPRLPLLLRESDGRELRTTAEILTALAAFADPLDRPGFSAFAEECAQALAATRLHDATRGRSAALLIAHHGDRLERWTGAAALAFDTLAARHDHPVYPTSRARAELSQAQLRAYAPEFHPRFALRWLAVPRSAVTVGGGVDFPAYWPTPHQLGLPHSAHDHLMLPVHPLTVGAPLHRALRDIGIENDCALVDSAYLEVSPTLSMRTVALTEDFGEHLKLPVATATLGRRNVRTVKPRTLADGALTHRILSTVLARESRFRDTILLADESTYAHAGHELLAVLRRGMPAEVRDSVVVPMAAVTARAHDGRRVLDHLADAFYDGDPTALFDAWITLLFDWQATLFEYGIALESHQQNVSLVLDGAASGRARLRLLFKDNDTPRIHTARLRDRLGAEPAVFADPRVNVADDRPLTDLFTTITVHLCAAAYAFELAALGYGVRSALVGLVRDRLAQAIDRLPPEPAACLRAHVLDAENLPVKAMVSAGTLFDKERSGATDINKHYVRGPNYLRVSGGAR
ncbi:Siderophore synthetase component [Nocardia amikacinitolerans]|uniref:IucA/IucC family protein n=1 Tax=Nocardia amikacinitolerans TaxID=756689 RepID=UPI00082BAFEF|nr:IucA/IucC family protein [Nocardia amikacinitolerans]MCP2319183.1 Siderophore synthetase component [Nocardia amikacinitolerans]